MWCFRKSGAMRGMLVEDLCAGERSRFLFPSSRTRCVWSGECTAGLGPWLTGMGRTFQSSIRLLIDKWHEWEINHYFLSHWDFRAICYCSITWPILTNTLRRSSPAPQESTGIQNVYLLQARGSRHSPTVLCYGSSGQKKALNHKRNPRITLRDCCERLYLFVNIKS